MGSGFAVRLRRAFAAMGVFSLTAQASLADPVTTRQLVEVVDVGGLAASPDGRLVAFRTEQASIERNTYQTVWYVQPVDGSAPPKRLGEGGEPLRNSGGLSTPEEAVWSSDGRWIFYRVVLDGRVEVWRAAVDGSHTERVTDDAANVRAFSLGADGGTLVYSVGATREAVVAAELAEYDRGVHIDRTVPLGDNLFRSGFHEGRLATQRLISNELERFPLLTSTPDRWKSVDLSTGVTTDAPVDATPALSLKPSDLSTLGEVAQVAEDPSTGRIAIITQSGDPADLVERPNVELAILAGRSSDRPSMRCTAALCVGKRITDIQWRPGGEEIIFTVTDRDAGLAQSIFRWNVATGAVAPVIRSDGELGGGGRWAAGPCAPSATALVCVAAEADRPPRLERVDLESGARRVLFDPNPALAQDMAKSVPVRLLAWTDGQGNRFTGRFYPAVSTDGAPPPLFVAYYRCAGFVRGGMGDEWPLATLAGHGVAALCLNAAPTAVDAVQRYQQGLSAIDQAVALLAVQGEIDPTRIGLGGLSFGAEVSMWSAMHSDLARAVSVSTPVMSPAGLLLLSPWDSYLSRLERFWQLRLPDDTPDRWRQMSPAYDTERIKAPVLMQMSEQEWRSSFDYAVPMIRSQQADAYVFPNEPHQKFQPRHKLAVYDRNLDWFRFWLQNYEDSDPSKADQYRRWREMRAQRAAREAGSPIQ
jgi:dipeptidyl aminopeptidase/acylaminoacyl peptidase